MGSRRGPGVEQPDHMRPTHLGGQGNPQGAEALHYRPAGPLSHRGTAGTPPGPRPSAPSWTSILLGGRRTGRTGRSGRDRGTKRRSGPHPALWSGQPRQLADADPFRAQSAGRQPALASAGSAWSPPSGPATARRPEHAPGCRAGREGRSPRTQTARWWPGTDAAVDLPPRDAWRLGGHRTLDAPGRQGQNAAPQRHGDNSLPSASCFRVR